MQKYQILSPDGFPIDMFHEGGYTEKEAKKGRIDLDDLADFCDYQPIN